MKSVDFITRMILRGGGYRSMILNQTVTTVVIGDLAEKRFNLICS